MSRKSFYDWYYRGCSIYYFGELRAAAKALWRVGCLGSQIGRITKDLARGMLLEALEGSSAREDSGAVMDGVLSWLVPSQLPLQ